MEIFILNKDLKTFKARVSFVGWGYVTVLAKSLEAAQEKIDDQDFDSDDIEPYSFSEVITDDSTAELVKPEDSV